MDKKILVATKNAGKISEYNELFKDLPYKLLTLADLRIKDEPKENGKTFTENAIKKVEFYSQISKFPSLAEDSGLEIDYLNGEPGVFSRRWLGRKRTDEELIQITLKKMKGVPQEKRDAQLRVVIAFKLNKEAVPITTEGTLRGRITEKPMAEIIPGYPFRSIFYVPAIDKVLAELSMAEEAKIAHRKMALEKLIPKIRKLI